MDKITKEMLIGDVVQKYPETVEVFMSFGLHCIGCHVSAFETIEQGANAHGVVELEKLVEELNSAIKNDKEKE